MVPRGAFFFELYGTYAGGGHMHPKILKGLSLGLSFQFFEYLSFEFEYFANLLQISKNII